MKKTIFFAAFAVFAFFAVQTAWANSVDDSYISSVEASVSDTTLGATATYTVAFTTTEDLAAGYLIIIDAFDYNCQAPSGPDCYAYFYEADADFSEVETEVADGPMNTKTLHLLADLPAGEHTVTLTNVPNPGSAVVLRVGVKTDASDEQALLGDEFDESVNYTTVDDTPMLFGTLLISGMIYTPEGTPLSSASVNFHNENWSKESHGSVDEFGFYAIFTDYRDAGYWTAGDYTLSVYPYQDTPYLQSDIAMTYDGLTALSADVTLEAPTSFFTGSVVYGDNDSVTVTSAPGDPVTNAWVWFWSEENGSGFGASTDGSGNFTVGAKPGSYNVQLSPSVDWSNEEEVAAIDWAYQNQWDKTYKIEEGQTKDFAFTVTLTTALLTYTAADASGNPISGSLQLTNKERTFSGWTEDGSSVLNLNPGLYNVYFYPNTWQHPEWENLYLDETTITINEGSDNQLDLILQEKTSFVHLIVTDQDGRPLEGVSAQAWRENEYMGKQTSSTGEATLYLRSDLDYDVGVWSENYIYNEPSQKVKLAENTSMHLDFVMYSPDARINVSVKDKDGNIGENIFGYTWCETKDHRSNFGGDVRNGVGTINVLTNTSTNQFKGTCNLWLSDESFGAATGQSVSVARGETASVEFTLVARDATIRIFVKDNNTGKLLKNSSGGRVNVYNEETNMGYDQKLDEDGKVDLQVVPGTYSGNVWFEEQDYIPLWNKNNKKVDVQSGETQKLVLNVLIANGQLEVKVKDSDGNSVEHGWAYCGNWAEVNDKAKGDFETGVTIDTGGEVIDGKATVPLISGHEYECNVGLPQEYQEENWLSPEHKIVNFASAKTKLEPITLKFKEADSSLSGDLIFEGGVEPDNAWCWAWSEKGGSSNSDAREGTYSLAMQGGQKWHAGCEAQVGDDWYRVADEYYREINEAGDYTKDFTLYKSSSWRFYDSVSETFTASENKTITMEDGTTVTMPAYSLASSGEVTVSATPAAEFDFINGDKLLSIPWNFEAFQGGELIESFNSSVTIEIHYTDEQLEEMGVDEDNLIGKYYDETSGTWKQPANITQNKGANTITITVDHFTKFGITYSAKLKANKKPNKPRSLKATDITSNSVTLTWKRPKNSAVKKYQVQLRENKSKKKKTWEKFKKVKAREKTITGLDSGTTYQFRIKAVNGAGSSKFTKWQKFTTL